MPLDAALNPRNFTRGQGCVGNMIRGTWVYRILASVWKAKKHLLRRSEGERILRERFELVHGRQLSTLNPQSFTEKLYCRMISLNRKSNPHFTQVSDKYAAREYVRSKVGMDCLVPLLWQGEDPREIPFDMFPEAYVIKTNHGSKQVIVVKDKADRAEIVSKLSGWLTKNYYWAAREGQYFDIKPKIMIEKFLSNMDGSGPLDYRFWCFGGVPEVIQVDNHAHDINPFFDSRWNQLDLYYREQAARPCVAKPRNFEQMLDLASRLSQGFDFVRIDLYNIDGKIYFGEFTLTPTGGNLKIRPESWDMKLGEKWVLGSVG